MGAPERGAPVQIHLPLAPTVCVWGISCTLRKRRLSGTSVFGALCRCLNAGAVGGCAGAADGGFSCGMGRIVRRGCARRLRVPPGGPRGGQGGRGGEARPAPAAPLPLSVRGGPAARRHLPPPPPPPARRRQHQRSLRRRSAIDGVRRPPRRGGGAGAAAAAPAAARAGRPRRPGPARWVPPAARLQPRTAAPPGRRALPAFPSGRRAIADGEQRPGQGGGRVRLFPRCGCWREERGVFPGPGVAPRGALQAPLVTLKCRFAGGLVRERGWPPGIGHLVNASPWPKERGSELSRLNIKA